jgi:hypothetical protein
MTQADESVVDFHFEDDAEWLGVNEETKAELDDVGKASTAKSSVCQAKKHMQRLKDFLRGENLSDKIEAIPVSILDEYFRLFYSRVRAENGRYLSPGTLNCIRSGIHRYLIGRGVNRPINIITDREFGSSNRMLKVVGTQYHTSLGAPFRMLLFT